MDDVKLRAVINPNTGEIMEYLPHKGMPISKDGQEMLDPTPIAPPLNYKKQPSMWDVQKQAIRQAKLELARELADELGAESPEDADDFDVDDDPEISTRYEIDETETVMEHRRRMLAAQSAALADDESAEGAEAKKPKASSRQAKTTKKEDNPSEQED